LDFYKVGCHDSLSALSLARDAGDAQQQEGVVDEEADGSEDKCPDKAGWKKRSLQEKVLQKSWWST
jgi:hypothetical protein